MGNHRIHPTAAAMVVATTVNAAATTSDLSLLTSFTFLLLPTPSVHPIQVPPSSCSRPWRYARAPLLRRRIRSGPAKQLRVDSRAAHGSSADVLETDELRHEQPQKYKQMEFHDGPIHPVLEKLRRELVEFYNSNDLLRSEASEMEEIRQEPEEVDRCLPVDFSALLACRERFVDEIRQKRRLRPRKKGLRSKRKSLRPKKKGSVLLGTFGLPSWLFAEADDDPLATRGATTDLSDSNYEEDEEEDKNGDKKDVLPSCPVQKCDLETVHVIAENRSATLGSLMLESHQEFLIVKGTGEKICPLPLLAFANVTRPCIVTRTCYHCRYRTDDITETDVSHRELEPENMVQVSSLTLPKTYPHSVSIYGIFAVRDLLHPGRNYLFKRSRDNPVTIHPGSSLPLCSPCRGIYALDLTLLDKA